THERDQLRRQFGIGHLHLSCYIPVSTFPALARWRKARRTDHITDVSRFAGISAHRIYQRRDFVGIGIANSRGIRTALYRHSHSIAIEMTAPERSDRAWRAGDDG
ncbi:hypothetical protein, partial [uncultured Novosphingobium sp.]|uniref:hypothetical protein n=1 Tax=uncultured Novosphingobium sp. TaxID=292277 RepID=UPI003749463B